MKEKDKDYNTNPNVIHREYNNPVYMFTDIESMMEFLDWINGWGAEALDYNYGNYKTYNRLDLELEKEQEDCHILSQNILEWIIREINRNVGIGVYYRNSRIYQSYLKLINKIIMAETDEGLISIPHNKISSIIYNDGTNLSTKLSELRRNRT